MEPCLAAAQHAATDLSGINEWITDIIDRFGSATVGVALVENVLSPISSGAVLAWSMVASVVGALVLYGIGAMFGKLEGRMKRTFLLIPVAVVAIGLPYAVANMAYVDSYFANNIGAPTPTQTTPVTMPDDPTALRIAVAGDVGTGEAAAHKTAHVMDSLDNQHDYDKLLLLGDNVYEDGDPSLVADRVLDPFDPVLDGPTELLAVLGNHDVHNNNGDAQAAALGMPARWYVNQTDLVTIIALDSTQPDNDVQLSWLRSTLDDSMTTWTIVMLHHPAYSAGWHGNDRGVQANFVPLFEAYGVDLVLAGHDHDYQRSKQINGVTYLVTGAAAKLRPTGNEEFTAVAWSTYSFVDLAIYPDHIDGQAINHDYRAIDTFAILAD